jgi:hypothetical protein
MSQDEFLNDPLSAFEQSLRLLSPQASQIDRDRLMFRLGQAAAAPAPRATWRWKLATAAWLLVSIGLGARLATMPTAEATTEIAADTNTHVVPPPQAARVVAASQTNSRRGTRPRGEAARLLAVADGTFDPDSVLDAWPSLARPWRPATRVPGEMTSEPTNGSAPVLRLRDYRDWLDNGDAPGAILSPAS